MEVARNFALLLNAKGVTVMITTLKDLIGGEIAELSTIADNITAPWFEKENNEMKRRITTLKKRGLIHDKKVCYIDFIEGKVMVDYIYGLSLRSMLNFYVSLGEGDNKNIKRSEFLARAITDPKKLTKDC